VYNSAFLGFDEGLPQKDIPFNRESDMIAQRSRVEESLGIPAEREKRMVMQLPPASKSLLRALPNSRGHENYVKASIQDRTYYSGPMPIMISKSLTTLSDILQADLTNLLYFHHSINNTARLLVDNDDLENPFRTLLPYSKHRLANFNASHYSIEFNAGFPFWQVDFVIVATSDPDMFLVLLAYSVFHRTAYTGHETPKEGIDVYLRRVSLGFRQTTEHQTGVASMAMVAIAIMLASMIAIAPVDCYLKAANSILKWPLSIKSDRNNRILSFLNNWLFEMERFSICSSRDIGRSPD